MKPIVPVLLVLAFVLPFTAAQVEVYSDLDDAASGGNETGTAASTSTRTASNATGDADISEFPVYVKTGADEQEVVVCSTPDKDKGYIIAMLPSTDLREEAVEAARQLFDSVDSGQIEALSDSFACVREEIADEEATAAGASTASQTSSGTNISTGAGSVDANGSMNTGTSQAVAVGGNQTSTGISGNQTTSTRVGISQPNTITDENMVTESDTAGDIVTDTSGGPIY